MKDSPSYRFLAGLLLLWAIAPLPFLYIVMPPFWLTAAVVGVFLVLRPEGTVRLSTGVQNVLGVVILVVVLAAGGVRVGPLRPLGHLLLLLTSVRTLLVGDRRSFLKALPAMFLVWLVSLTASTHVAALPYFGLSVVMWWWVGMQLHLWGIGERDGTGEYQSPSLRHVVVAATAAMMLAVPVFLVMPRLRAPWVSGRGGVQSVTGFSSRVQLSGVGTIRESQQEALTVRSINGEPIDQQWMRLRAAAYQRVTVDSWAPRSADSDSIIAAEEIVWHRSDMRRLDDTVELEVTVFRPRRFLFLPNGTIAIRSPAAVRLDPTGGVQLADSVQDELTYRVWVRRGEASRFTDPPRHTGPQFDTDPEILRLAYEIVGGGSSAAQQAAAIERHL